MEARELKSSEFTERLEPIFRSVESRLPGHLRGRKSEYFFPRWRALMDLGVARTWEIPGAVLGLLLVPDIFSGIPVASVPFWFSLPDTKGTLELLHAAEHAARESGCKRIGIASFNVLDGDRVSKIYMRAGYAHTECVFQKELS
jgi:hypothetical protein